MKYQILLIGLMLSMASCYKDDNIEKNSCIPGDVRSNVIAFYPFSNGTINDMSGNSHHLSNSTGAKSTMDRNGNLNCAYEFDNIPTSSEFLTTSNTSFLNNLQEFSISLWYDPLDTTRNVAAFESLVNRDIGPRCPDTQGQWSMGLYDCRKAVFGRTNSVWDNNIILSPGCTKEIIARTNIWSHLVATFKQSGIEMKIYRNGILQESSTGNGSCSYGVPTVQDIGDLFLGKDYTGRLDDVIIFDKVLTQTEVNNIFNMNTCCEE